MANRIPEKGEIVARKPECNFTPCLNQFTTCIRGKRHRLGTNEKVARERFDWLMREDGQVETVKEANPLLGDLFTPWLHYVEKQHAPDRFRLCRDRLLDFLRFIGEGARIG